MNEFLAGMLATIMSMPLRSMVSVGSVISRLSAPRPALSPGHAASSAKTTMASCRWS